ncbi:MAG: hypothetical protein Q8L35_02015 [Actinomycetota bacterium]|nr:hypothetical protein [Actinomycetota bacterium]
MLDLLDDKTIRLAGAMDRIKNKYGDRLITRGTLVNWRRRYHGVEPAQLGRAKRPSS